MSRAVCRRLGPLWAGAVVILLAGCSGGGPPRPTPDQGHVLVVVTPTPGPPPSRSPDRGDERRHIVRAGETLSAIAALYGVSLEELARVNQLTDPGRLLVGQELVIPPPEP